MSSHIFAGRVEGQPFVAAHTYVEAEQSQVAVAVDSVTPFNGTNMPEFDEAGWLFRPVANRLPHQRLMDTLERTGAEVHEVGEVPVEEVARYVGPAALKKAFKG